MQRSTKVTVYITNYNYEKYLEQSIESVLGQTYKDFELIIIDDGSTDRSKEIIEKYRDHYNVRIVYQKNKGLNITNNIAMRLAEGEYLVRLDADDYIMPHFLSVMVEKIESDPNIGLVFPDYYYVDASGEITGIERRFNFESDVTLFDLPAHGACTLIRLDFLKRLGGYNESFQCQDGYDLWLKFINAHRVVNINEPLFFYRRHDANLTNNEDRILNTRKRINKTYFSSQDRLVQNTVAIIPLRNMMIQGENWPFVSSGDKTIIEKKVELLKASEHVNHIVITSSVEDILNRCNTLFDGDEKVHIIERPSKLAQFNESLVKTHQHVVNTLKDRDIACDYVLTVSIEYPMVDINTVDDMFHSMVIYNTDSVISVRPNSLIHYRHNGSGLEAIMDQNEFTKFERDALYTGAGGLVLSKYELINKYNDIVPGRIGHVVVTKEVSFRVSSNFEFNLFKLMTK